MAWNEFRRSATQSNRWKSRRLREAESLEVRALLSLTPVEPVPVVEQAPADVDVARLAALLSAEGQDPNSMMRYDVEDGTVTAVAGAAVAKEASSGQVPPQDPLYASNWMQPDGTAPISPPITEADRSGAGPEYVFGTDNRSLVGQGNMTVYPWRTIGRVWMKFPDGAELSGTAEVIGSRTLLTAGHIVYDASHGGWANQLYFSAGQDGDSVYDPEWNSTFKRSEYQFYGEARALNFQTYTGWINGDWNYDMAFVALDRNIGSYTGWMGWGWNDDNNFFQNSTFNTAGYPGDLTPNAYDMWYTSGTLTTVNTLNLQTQIDTYPGQSGSPLWYLSGDRTIYATNSSQWTVGGNPAYNQFTRITGPRFTDAQNYINAWGAATDQSDLVDYDQWFDTDFAFGTPNPVTPGHDFTAHSYIRNNGTASAGSFTVSFYASTNTTISTGDYFIGSTTISGLSSYNWTDAIYTGAFPYIPDGNYYLGWIIDSGNSQSEYSESNNTGVIDTTWLQVISPPDVGDTLGTARNTGLGPGGGSYFDFNPIGNGAFGVYDVDLYRFQGTAGATVTLDTTQPAGGPAMDTILRLFDASGNQLTFDDDSGPGNYSHLAWVLPSTGTYYVGVSGWSNFTYNPNSGGSGTPGSQGEYNLAIALTGDTVAPRIGGSAITLRSTTGVHTPYVVPTGNGNQVRTVPVGNINQISIAFNEGVVVSQGNLTLLGAGSYSFSNFAYNAGTNTATWTLAAPLNAGAITLHLLDSVHDTSGNALDGEWDNPTGLADTLSGTLSGNGVAGGVFDFRFTVLPGDANRDNQVTGADYTIWADNYGDWAGNGTWGVGDFTGDGQVTGADYTLWADRYGISLQSPIAPGTPPTTRANATQFVNALPKIEQALPTPRRERLTAAIDDVLAAWEDSDAAEALEAVL